MLTALKRRAGIALFAVAAVAAAVGIAHATIPDQGGEIHGCYGSTGALRVIDAPSETCKNNETALTWSQRGPQGPAGVTGAPGPAGATGPAGPGSLNSAAMATAGIRPVPANVAVTLRAGTYFVIGVAEYYSDSSSSGFNSQCSFWRDAIGFDNGGTHISGVGDSAVFSGKNSDQGQVTLIATATLPSDTSIFFNCSADNDAEVVQRLITIKVDGIN